MKRALSFAVTIVAVRAISVDRLWDTTESKIASKNSLLLNFGCLVTIERLLRRADREAEGARLLSEYAPKGHLGFESPALRQFNFKEGSHRGPFFIIEKGRWGFEPERARALSKRESVCSPWAKSRQALKPEGMRSMPGNPQLSGQKNQILIFICLQVLCNLWISACGCFFHFI